MAALAAVAVETATPETKPETLTPEQKLPEVLNAIVQRRGGVKLMITRMRNNTCPNYVARTSAVFNEETAHRGPNGTWLIDIGGTLCAPQVGDIPFMEWIEVSHLAMSTPGATLSQPPGHYTRWN